ncbi:MAG: hypothetical protein NC124_15835 [Clostridium sp.]|nr:hypothetical protein [Clostridium sp.]
MKKTQIIREIIGKQLESFGFQYQKTDGSCRIFMREVKGVPRFYEPERDVVQQYINIQESRFSKEVTVRFSTDAYGHEGEYELEQIRKYGTGTWLGYIDEDTYRDRLRILAELIIEYGFDLLDKISVEDEMIPSKAMADRLYHYHEELFRAFVHQYSVKALRQETDIEDCTFLIKKLIMDSAGQPYDEVKDLIVSIAAFIGDSICESCFAEWIFPEHFKVPVVYSTELAFRISPLDAVLDLWKYQCDEERCILFFRIIISEWKQGLALQGEKGNDIK